MIPGATLARLLELPGFWEWLHDTNPRPIQVPIVEHPVSFDHPAMTSIKTVSVHKMTYWAPAPWAVEEYVYVCHVAVCGDLEIARSEYWRRYRDRPMWNALTVGGRLR